MAEKDAASSGAVSDAGLRSKSASGKEAMAATSKAWFINWDGSTCQDVPAATLPGAPGAAAAAGELGEAPPPKTEPGAAAARARLQEAALAGLAEPQRGGASPRCSDSELSLVVSSGEDSVPETPRKLSSWDTIRNKDALINELRERCAALETEGVILRERIVKMEEDGQNQVHTARVQEELVEMTKSVANLHQRQDAEVQRLRTELAAAQAMLKGVRGRARGEAYRAATDVDHNSNPACCSMMDAKSTPAEYQAPEPQQEPDFCEAFSSSRELRWQCASDSSPLPTYFNAGRLRRECLQLSDSDCASDSSGSLPPTPSSMKRLETGVLVGVPRATPSIAQQLSAQAPCPQGHLLQPQTPNGHRWICDGCEADHEATSLGARYRCIQCDFDLCEGCCHAKAEEHLQTRGTSCTRGHHLAPQLATAAGDRQLWMCDICHQRSDDLLVKTRFRCHQCDYDLCSTCYARGKEETTDQPLLTNAGTSGNATLATDLSRADSGSSQGSQIVHERFVMPAARIAPPAFERGRQLCQEVPGLRRRHSLDTDHRRQSAAQAFHSTAAKRCSSLDLERTTCDGSRPSTPSFGSPCTELPSSGSSVTSSARSSPPQPQPVGSFVAGSRPVNPQPGLAATAFEALPTSTSPATCTLPAIRPQSYSQRLSLQPSPGAASLGSSVSSTDSGVGCVSATTLPAQVQPGGAPLPVTREAFVFLHNSVAMPLMRRTADLGKAYRHLGEANALHIRLYGVASGEALYNMACCLALGAAAAAGAGAGAEDPAAGLPPAPGELASARELADARLDKSAKMLEVAVELGYTDVTNMAVDADLLPLREHRPEVFAAVMGRARGLQRPAPGGAVSCCSRKVPQASPPVLWAKV